MKRLGIITALMIAVAVALYVGLRGSATKPTAAGGSAGGARGASGAPAEPTATTRSARKVDTEMREKLLAAIQAARTKRAGGSRAGTTTAGSAPQLPEPELSKQYIRQQLKEIVPLMIECYETALERDSQIAGKLTMKFSIGGEPDVGGVVETSEVDAANSTITDPGMLECMRETMYALELVAPEQGGRVDVTYPFEFRPNE